MRRDTWAIVRWWASALEVFVASYEARPSFVEFVKETCDVRQNSYWTSELALSGLAHETSATTSFTDVVKNLELAKIPDGCKPFLGMATQVPRQHHGQFRRNRK